MNAGFAADRLARLTRGMQAYVDRGEVPGLVTLLLRDGREAHCDVLGAMADGGPPMRRDALFRLGSMTKPILSVVALSLLEEGRLRLRDRVDRWLPELAGARVLRTPTGPLDDTVPAPRPILVEDLFLHRAGFATSSLPQGPIGRAAQALSGGISQRPDLDADAWLAILATLPLLHAPGERVVNGFASDVLGILLERLTGQRLDALMEERVLGPLAMRETRFSLPAHALDLLPAAYNQGWLSGTRAIVDEGASSYWARQPRFLSGGGGLIGPADDYARFGTMLLNGGRLGEARILSRKTVALMTSNFLTPEQRRIPFFGADYWADRGFGLGVFVTDDPARRGAPVSIGQYGWRGAFATYWFNDPAERITAILMLQVAFPAVVPPILADFETLVGAAIDD